MMLDRPNPTPQTAIAAGACDFVMKIGGLTGWLGAAI